MTVQKLTEIDTSASKFWSALYAQWTKAKLPNEPVEVKARIVRALLRKFPEAEDTILALGAEKAMAKISGNMRGTASVTSLAKAEASRRARNQEKYAMWERQAEEERVQEHKAASFDRMVQALDAIKVGSKLLGDCTGADLLREAHRLENIAGEVTAQAVFYRELASIAGKTKTVREAADRTGVIALLTSRYKEAA